MSDADNWYDEVFEGRIRLGLKVSQMLHTERSEFQQIDVFDSEAMGRTLALDGVLQTSEVDERFYHEMLVHPALCTAPSIRRVLVIGGGDGGTAREVLRHREVEYCRMVEIDRRVVELSRQYLPTIGTAWDDPRLDLVFGDGVAHVTSEDVEPYDVVILDGSDPVGPSLGLFGRDFYAGVARVLAPNGVFALQSESPFLMERTFTAIQAALPEFFPRSAPYLGWVPLYGTGMWSWTLAGPTLDHQNLHESRIEAIADGCRVYSAEIHRACFALPPLVRAMLP